jgi:hypothetical protein
MWLEVPDVHDAIKAIAGRKKLGKHLSMRVDQTGDRIGTGLIPADFVIAIFANNGAATGQKGVKLAKYLASRGVGASVHHADGPEYWVILFDPSLIKSVVRIQPQDVGTRKFPWDLPIKIVET